MGGVTFSTSAQAAAGGAGASTSAGATAGTAPNVSTGATPGNNGVNRSDAGVNSTTSANGTMSTTSVNNNTQTGASTGTSTTTTGMNTTSTASVNGRNNQNGSDQLGHLTQDLNLTATQQQRLRPLLSRESQELQALRNDRSLSPELRSQRAQAIYIRYQGQINGNLTPDQRTRYESSSAQWRSRWVDSINGTQNGLSTTTQAPAGATIPAGQ